MDLRSCLSELMRYYDRRAPEYEELYYRTDPLRRGELERAAATMRNCLEGRRVLELACGTGYWTERLVGCVRSVLAVDSSSEMLSLARRKKLPREVVDYSLADAYHLESINGEFDGGMANFWLSHVPKSMLGRFVRGFHARLGPGAVVFMMDNFRIPGYGGEFIRVAGSEDTFRRRELQDGSSHEIIKNYYDEAELRRLLSPHADALEVNAGEYYWWLNYRVAEKDVGSGVATGF